MIPQEKIAAATRGLSEAFGVAAFDDIRELTERPGSNRAFRIVVRGSAYLLRINTRAGDAKRHFGCMQAAAEAGLAPRVRYANAEDRISITDFVEALPLPAADALPEKPRIRAQTTRPILEGAACVVYAVYPLWYTSYTWQRCLLRRRLWRWRGNCLLGKGRPPSRCGGWRNRWALRRWRSTGILRIGPTC